MNLKSLALGVVPTALLALGLPLLSHQAMAQDAFAFHRGDAFPPARPTPAAWLMELHKADELLNSNIAVAEFLPNTRLAWHHHPGGQILLITDGVGYYQEKGKPKQIVRVGDVVKCDPEVQHWHGASVDSGVTYVAISPAHKGPTVWAQAVTDAEYTSPASDKRNRPKPRKTGAADLAEIHKGDATFPFKVASVNFAPGKRLGLAQGSRRPNPPSLPAGTGYYQEREKPKQGSVRKGDVIWKSRRVPNTGTALLLENGVTQIAITPVSELHQRSGCRKSATVNSTRLPARR